MDIVCNLIPNTIPENGYHRECYQRLTMNLGRLKARKDVEDESGPSRRSSTVSSDGIIFNQDCIFYNKTGLKKIKSKEHGRQRIFQGSSSMAARLSKMLPYKKESEASS